MGYQGTTAQAQAQKPVTWETIRKAAQSEASHAQYPRAQPLTIAKLRETYGMEVVLQIELEIPSLRVLLENQINEVEWLQSRHDELVLLDERRLKAMVHTRAYQARMARAFDKKVKHRDIQEGDLVQKEKPPTHANPLGKWEHIWIGPYVVQKIFSGGAVQLADLDGNPFVHPVNGDKLRRYYA